jgi:riboflavin kinase
VDTLNLDLKSWKLFFTLYKLAELGASSRTIKVSTEYLAEKIGASQQTASRHLIKLENIGWIARTITPEGCLTKITKLGVAELKKLYSELRIIFESIYPPSITLEGVLFRGLGEGAYYVTKDGYRKQFIEKLGFDPYPGTLNIKLITDYDLKSLSELETYPAIELEGFVDESRTFGSVKCYPAMINNKAKGAVIHALRSHYGSSVLEIVSPNFLRNKLKLKDGNKVKVEILLLP